MLETPATTLNCRQCSAPLPVEQGRQFVKCEFCGAENFVDKRRAILHYAVKDTVRPDEAVAALRRWMAGNQTVKNLDSKAQITETTLQLIPLWLVRAKQKGVEKVVIEPAVALPILQLLETTIPAASLMPFDHSVSQDALEPTVPYDTVIKWLKENQKIEQNEISEMSLVHLPIYVCKYQFDGRSYTAVVDAASSKVFADVFPSKWEAPYLTIAAVAFALYFCASLIPAGGYMNSGGAGLAAGTGIYCLASVVIAIPIFIVASMISAKV